MNNFKTKRRSLEGFVKEQIIGPGALNKRYFFLEKWASSEFKGAKLDTCLAFSNKSEILTEVPAYQYSSGIIFPETRIKARQNSSFEGTQAEEAPSPEPLNNVPNGADDEDIKDHSSDSLVSRQQNYPNSFGLSFVLDKSIDIEKDISVSLTFRKYKLIHKESAIKNRFACWVPEYQTEIEDAISKYFAPLFESERIDGNLFVVIKKRLLDQEIYDVDYKMLNTFLEEYLIPIFKNVFHDKLHELKEKNGIKYYGIENDKTFEFYSIAEENRYGGKNVITIFNSNLISYIEEKLNKDIGDYANYSTIIKALEIYNQLRELITDLKSVFKPKNSSPIWEAQTYENIHVSMPKFQVNNIFRQRGIKLSEVGDDFKDINYSVQYVTRKNEVYVKIIIVNKASIVLDENEPPQLNKKNEANLKSFFGITLHVCENRPGVLKEYNPPQLLDFDEEDNFNKLLYRNYRDYAEGYNTSVNWGKSREGLKFVSTEFLPEQETPNVDFKPSKIVANKIQSRIVNEDVLSMAYLSTLVETKDSDIVANLFEIIKQYEVWIEEKRTYLDDDNTNLQKEEIRILFKQLEACKRDSLRLKRNIELLKKDSKAMAAFRSMNTAMFMQLHHGKEVRESKKSNVSFKFNSSELEYKAIALVKINEYKWRSFQLAFILLNIDGFVKPQHDENIVEDVFGTGWPERNEIADLVWFPTGGGKTEAYLGIIAFAILYRRFTQGHLGFGTTVLMRYTLRLLTLQQFQRATLLICAIEIIRKNGFLIPSNFSLGEERITIGLFVGSGSLPNSWKGNDKSMENELKKISSALEKGRSEISTNLPFTECPWCGEKLFVESGLKNVSHRPGYETYGINDQFNICCNNTSCGFAGKGKNNRPTDECSLPLRLFDDDIYKFPPTLLFGTVDKFAALANNISTESSDRNRDSRRLFGKGFKRNTLPPDLIIQDELHLLLGPLGSAVGLFERGIEHLCTYEQSGHKVKPKVITSTATTRNTDKQIFALFNRRSEIFPKQGILSDDSFFAYYQRANQNIEEYLANRKYVGVLPVGKTQVWMQLRITAIALAHRVKFFKENYSLDETFLNPENLNPLLDVFDFYHTVLSYFNSLKDVGKTQSQLSHYLPGDVNFVIKNTLPWSFLDKLIRNEGEIDYSELTGRLKGEEVKTNLSNIEKNWRLFKVDSKAIHLNRDNPPEFVISTNMISVGIDIARFNTMIINSMPRNVAEYIQASSRVARKNEGIVFTIHHPFRSRDISHYQRYKEFHEKFYSYVEPISVTPFANKALNRYFAMFLSVMIRHDDDIGLRNNKDASFLNDDKIKLIKKLIKAEFREIQSNAVKLQAYLSNRKVGIVSSIDGIIEVDEIKDIDYNLDKLIGFWLERLHGTMPVMNLEYRTEPKSKSLFITGNDENYPTHWKVGYSLREIDPSTIIKTVQQ